MWYLYDEDWPVAIIVTATDLSRTHDAYPYDPLMYDPDFAVEELYDTPEVIRATRLA